MEPPPVIEKKPKKRVIWDRRSAFFSVATLVLFGVLAGLLVRRESPPSPARGARQAWTAEQARQYASDLESKGLKRQAIDAYMAYADRADAAPEERANIYYKVGKLYTDLAEYESALAAFLRVTIADPKTKLENEVGLQIVECWERLGRNIDAQYALRRHAGMEKPDRGTSPRGAVVAQIGSRKITMGELDDAIRRMPWGASQLKTKAQKFQFLQQYIAGELLFDKAKRLRLHESPQARAQMRDLEKQVLAQMVLKQEVQDQIKIDPTDVPLYYEANKDKYRVPARAKISLILFEDEKAAKAVLADLRAGKIEFADAAKAHSAHKATKDKAGKLDQWVSADGYVPGVGVSAELGKAIFATAQGSVCQDPVKTPSGSVVFRVDEQTPSQQKSLEEVRKQVAFDYRQEKVQKGTQALLTKLQQTNSVKVFEEQFVEAPDAAKEGK